MNENETTQQAYIGDGVYASYDGYHVKIAVNHHLNHVVAFEPMVMELLIGYYNRVVLSRVGQEYVKR
jgi:hypothetical protein